MDSRKRKRLQRMIDRTAKASSAYYKAQAELNDWCLATYGFEPGDIDADNIIDSLFGGGGDASTMSAEEFDGTMRGELYD